VIKKGKRQMQRLKIKPFRANVHDQEKTHAKNAKTEVEKPMLLAKRISTRILPKPALNRIRSPS
jgi:hypothetical protein